MTSIRRLAAALGTAALLVLASASARAQPPGPPSHGIAMHGTPALPAGFTHFTYVNPDAPKGGQLRLGQAGSFDSLNPFIFKGVVAPGLREYVFDSLLARSADEPFTLYGLVAGRIDLPADRGSATFHLRPGARFASGRPITAEDVVFSWRMLRERGVPFYRSHYGKVAAVDVLSPLSLRFTFEAGGDRELPLLVGLMPILPRETFGPDTFDLTTLTPYAASGPYVIGHVDAGRSLVLKRNPDYWGRDLPTQRGRFNFDEIRYTFYRDSSTMLEAFKAGEIDVRVETDPGRWAESYDFPALKRGDVIKAEVPIGLPAGMSALVFNTRRAPFDDQRVRRALIEAFDAEWINRSLYHGLYTRTESFFSRSELAAAGRPADQRERALLAPFAGAVRPEIMDGTWRLSGSSGTGSDRAGLKRAGALLAEAGYVQRGGQLVHAATGKPLAFEFLASSRTQERLVLAYQESLKRLGVTLRLRQVDNAQYWGRMSKFDFEMTQWNWGASLSPGNEQLNRWSSAAADNPGTLNYAGVKSAAADAMIDALLKAEGREDFISAVRSLDRVLVSGDYVIPLYHARTQWLAHWKRLSRPGSAALSGIDLDTWWEAR